MSLNSYGLVKVTVAGTPVKLTANGGWKSPFADHPFQSLFVEADPANTGKIFVGFSNMVRATRVGVLAVIPPPTANSFGFYSPSEVTVPAGHQLDDLYMDADNSGEGGIVSTIVG